MYINPFIGGMLTVILVELLIVVGLAWFGSKKK